MGNLGSIQNMIRRIGYPSSISSSVEEIAMADKLILPGVGHFDRGMENLESMGLIDILNKKSNRRKNTCTRYMPGYAADGRAK